MPRAFLVRDLTDDALTRAHARAKSEGTSLTAIVRQLVLAYADGKALPASLGHRGGKSRAQKMTAGERSASARVAARARWAKTKGQP